MTASEALATAREYKKNHITLSDFNQYVQVIYQEGTVQFFHNATARQVDDEWTAIFPEHHPSFMVHSDDARVYLYAERLPVPKM